jgi:hypothetical protein
MTKFCIPIFNLKEGKKKMNIGNLCKDYWPHKNGFADAEEFKCKFELRNDYE